MLEYVGRKTEKRENMTFSRKAQWRIFIGFNGVLILAVLLYPLYDKYLTGTSFNSCNMLDFLHLYCPACGGTRAFASLIKFDILASFKYNPIVPVCAAVFIACDIDMIKHLVRGTKEREMLVKPWMVYVFLIMWLVYFIVRNVLLFYGIDLVGNVLI